MMLVPQINYITCNNTHESYKMYYTAWGYQENAQKTLICIHGLNRNSRDWDYVGQYFASKGYYVVAPDIVGRGNSDYLKNYVGYDVPFYVMDILHLIQTLQLTNIELLGTSMGGLIGMAIASSSPQPLQKLIMNDIGAEVESAGLTRIGGYTGKQNEYQSYAEAKQYLLDLCTDFGVLPDSVWEEFARHSLQRNANGKYELKRDVNLSKTFANSVPAGENLDLWSYWQTVSIPTLVIRGVESDILSCTTVEKMKAVNPETQSVEIANVGHAPFLYSHEHCQMLEQFLSC